MSAHSTPFVWYIPVIVIRGNIHLCEREIHGVVEHQATAPRHWTRRLIGSLPTYCCTLFFLLRLGCFHCNYVMCGGGPLLSNMLSSILMHRPTYVKAWCTRMDVSSMSVHFFRYVQWHPLSSYFYRFSILRHCLLLSFDTPAHTEHVICECSSHTLYIYLHDIYPLLSLSSPAHSFTHTTECRIQ